MEEESQGGRASAAVESLVPVSPLHTYTHGHTHTDTDTHGYTHTQIHTHTNMHACAVAHVLTYMCIYSLSNS